MLELKRWCSARSTKKVDDFNRTMLELKLFYSERIKQVIAILIAPCWNWNGDSLIQVFSGWFYFNRTMLELKLIHLYNENEDILDFNRTMLELKHVPSVLNDWHNTILIAPCWNWNTYVHFLTTISFTILIAPCWNWNLVHGFDVAVEFVHFNRTMLELKLPKSPCLGKTTW